MSPTPVGVGCADWDGHIKVDAAVRPSGVVVRNVLVQYAFEGAAVPDQDPVEAFGPDGAYPPLGVAVCAGRPRRNLDGLDTGRGEHRVEGGGELGVPVADEEPQPVGLLIKVHQQITRRLGNPRAGRMRGDAGQVDPTVIKLDHEQHVQAGQPDRLDGEEIAGEGPAGLRT
jgi:hypothetical protein